MAEPKTPSSTELAQQAQKAALEGVKAREAVKNEQVAEYYAREAELRPTPTQAELDQAKVGAPPDQLEDHGAEPDEVGVKKVLEGRIPANNPYLTRDMNAPNEPAPQGEPVRRGPGRPRADEAAPKAEEKK